MSATTPQSFDLLVIGWGKAGKTLARRYALAGKSVALVERSPQMYGGTCINIGCVPTKDLVETAHLRRPDDDPAAYFRAAVDARDALIGKLNAANHGMLEGQATLFDGTARFTGPKQVTIATADGDVEVTAENIVIGTGTVPARPPIEGIDLPGVHDSTTIQHVDPLPRRLAVIGSGFIGLEFANMFRLFGSEVTVIDGASDLLPRSEPAVVEEVRSVLTGHGIEFRFDAKVERFERTDTGVRVVTTQGDVDADAVLVAVGRTPATADLGLDEAGIDTDDRGFIAVDDRLRTSVDGVWAVGDVNGGPQFTYISLDDNRIVWDQLTGSGGRTTADRVAVPNTTFLTPPLAQVGMTPAEAVEAGHEVLYAAQQVAKIAAMPRPKILGDPSGIITFTVDAKDRKVLGATLFCSDAQEVVNLVALAIRQGATAEDLLDGIWTHPSSTEALNEVLGGLRPYGS